MSGTAPTLPPQVRVFVRDWLSSNNILLKGREGHVLIDSGYGRHAPLTLALLATTQGLGAAPLARLVNTHCHSDHMGGNAAIKARYDCPIALPDGEAPLIDAWDENTLLLAYTDQRADRFAYNEVIRAGETHIWGDLEWQVTWSSCDRGNNSAPRGAAYASSSLFAPLFPAGSPRRTPSVHAAA